jgi:hypothetical protein
MSFRLPVNAGNFVTAPEIEPGHCFKGLDHAQTQAGDALPHLRVAAGANVRVDPVNGQAMLFRNGTGFFHLLMPDPETGGRAADIRPVGATRIPRPGLKRSPTSVPERPPRSDPAGLSEHALTEMPFAHVGRRNSGGSSCVLREIKAAVDARRKAGARPRYPLLASKCRPLSAKRLEDSPRWGGFHGVPHRQPERRGKGEGSASALASIGAPRRRQRQAFRVRRRCDAAVW